MTEFTNQPWPRGCVQVYTGNGKGKTTAAFGLALRAAGRGLKTYVGQLMKGSDYGELVGASMLDGLVAVEQLGSPECIPLRDEPDPRDVELAREGLERCREAMLSGEYRIVIVDEGCVAVRFKLIAEIDLLSLVDDRPDDVELIITGRYAPEALIERADLVTEMTDVKHYFDTEKLLARDGIER
jgi:cob(I)alamin adenosyltransferase